MSLNQRINPDLAVPCDLLLESVDLHPIRPDLGGDPKGSPDISVSRVSGVPAVHQDSP